ncbi:MAG TPA: polyprenol monophosphomannose synthase [Streptosporangiales bacterium]
MPTALGDVLVVVPTYDERDNIAPLVARIHRVVPAAHVLVVDDGSPDGTGEVADGLADRDGRVHVLHRTAKQGLGAAYVAGFGWGLLRGYDVLVEMDADGSHHPEELPWLLQALEEADLVLGSRWVPEGSVSNWSLARTLLSRAGNAYARAMLRLPLHDVTGGYRAYRATTLRRIDLEQVESQGYCFQIDLALRVARAGMRVVEVPITFTERTSGTSKMSRSVVIEALQRVTLWGLHARFGRNPRSGKVLRG